MKEEHLVETQGADEEGNFKDISLVQDELTALPVTDNPSTPILYCGRRSQYIFWITPTRCVLCMHPQLWHSSWPTHFGIDGETLPKWKVFGFSTNPGLFNKKEHYLIMANVPFPAPSLF